MCKNGQQKTCNLSCNLSCDRLLTGLTWVVKHATLLFNLFCNNVARQVARFLLPIFTDRKLRGHYKRPYIVIRYLYKFQDGVWDIFPCVNMPILTMVCEKQRIFMAISANDVFLRCLTRHHSKINTVWLCTISGDNIHCCIYYITLPNPLKGNQKMLVISSNTTLYLPFWKHKKKLLEKRSCHCLWIQLACTSH